MSLVANRANTNNTAGIPGYLQKKTLLNASVRSLVKASRRRRRGITSFDVINNLSLILAARVFYRKQPFLRKHEWLDLYRTSISSTGEE